MTSSFISYTSKLIQKSMPFKYHHSKNFVFTITEMDNSNILVWRKEDYEKKYVPLTYYLSRTEHKEIQNILKNIEKDY